MKKDERKKFERYVCAFLGARYMRKEITLVQSYELKEEALREFDRLSQSESEKFREIKP